VKYGHAVEARQKGGAPRKLRKDFGFCRCADIQDDGL
jgi:hypothetical protein